MLIISWAQEMGKKNYLQNIFIDSTAKTKFTSCTVHHFSDLRLKLNDVSESRVFSDVYKKKKQEMIPCRKSYTEP